MNDTLTEPLGAASGRYEDWKAPPDDGRMLIWPPPPDLLRHARENHRRLSALHSVRLQGVPLPELRRRQRQWIGHGDPSGDSGGKSGGDDRLLIATGHQTELYHPGVWAKDALIHAAARRLDAAAYHFAIDTDSPKHLHLRYPGGSRPITDDPALFTAEWSALLDGPTPRHLRGLEEELREARAGWDFEPAAFDFLASLRKLTLEQPTLVNALTNATHELDWQLGLRHHALVMSPVWHGEPYLVFAHHLLARADEFAAHYNAALADYRREQGIRAATRPMPDLGRGDAPRPGASGTEASRPGVLGRDRAPSDACEAPFWFDHLGTGRRQRARVARSGGHWALEWQGDRFALDPATDGWRAADELLAWLRHHDLRLAPRALTLTLFFRLLLVDQFVHGIGGGRYDQVTDRLIANAFGIDPPHFSVTTATLYFPAAVGQRRVNLRPMLQEGRRLRHGMLSPWKREAVRGIENLPRRSRPRRELYAQMHARLATESNSPAIRHWEQQFIEAQRQSLAQKVLFDRELFYGVQSASRLSAMVERYDAAFG